MVANDLFIKSQRIEAVIIDKIANWNHGELCLLVTASGSPSVQIHRATVDQSSGDSHNDPEAR